MRLAREALQLIDEDKDVQARENGPVFLYSI